MYSAASTRVGYIHQHTYIGTRVTHQQLHVAKGCTKVQEYGIIIGQASLTASNVSSRCSTANADRAETRSTRDFASRNLRLYYDVFMASGLCTFTKCTHQNFAKLECWNARRTVCAVRRCARPYGSMRRKEADSINGDWSS